jgi:dCTP deaminase
MLLADVDIASALRTGQLKIDPFDPKNLQPSSVDVHLGDTIRYTQYTHENHHIDPYNVGPELTVEVDIPDEGYVLYPRRFVLATTSECLTLSGELASRLEGRSSLGRMGLSIHATAGFIDPGFSGQVTLEMSIQGTLPILLRKGMPIGQLCFFKMSRRVQTPYGSRILGSKYQGQRGPTPPRSLRMP